MSFVTDEKGQMGPIEDLFGMSVIVMLMVLFLGVVAYSYQEYAERRAPIERFSAGLDFTDTLKNNVLSLRTDGVPSPGLIDEDLVLSRGYSDLARYWNRGYSFEVVLRDMGGSVIYEQGDMTRKNLSTTTLESSRYKDVTVVYSVVAIHDSNNNNRPGRLEVWVWS